MPACKEDAMVQGIGDSPVDISRLLGILSRTGVRTDA